MKLISVRSLTMIAMIAGSTQITASEAVDQSALKTEAREIVKTFGGQLKPRLKSAIQNGGLVHAIAVCSVEAPRIASELSRQTGWQVSRVSLKPRNRKLAEPDSFETRVLKTFDKTNKAVKHKDGPPEQQANALEYAEISEGNYRYMKAQQVEGICLNCHGSDISAEVKSALNQVYPDDTARGYALGDVRGAFSLTKSLAAPNTEQQ